VVINGSIPPQRFATFRELGANLVTANSAVHQAYSACLHTGIARLRYPGA
jgi:hypothetical protein